VVVVVIDGSVDVDAAGAITDELDAILRRREPVGFVFDYQAGPPGAQQRVSMWLAERIEALRVLCVAAVTVVAPERVEHVQGLIEGGMFTMPFDTWATGSVDEGVAWVAARFASAG
jgi:hypothetical protein